MKAAIVEHIGEKGSIQSIIDPEPGEYEVVVRVVAAGINPVDWKLRDIYNRPKPFILGQDFAGFVVGVGGKVDSYRYGDRVFGIARQHGAYAEITVCPVNDPTQPLARIPDSVSDSDAASVPTPGLTAMACFEGLTLPKSAHIALIGVSGSVGQIALQLAHNAGMHVSGVGGLRSENVIRNLGIENYIVHDLHGRDGIVGALRHLAPSGFDAILDFATDARNIMAFGQLVKPGGTLISTNHAIETSLFEHATITARNVNLNGSRAASHEGLRAFGALLESGAVIAPQKTERSFGEALETLELVKYGKLAGKVIVTFP